MADFIHSWIPFLAMIWNTVQFQLSTENLESYSAVLARLCTIIMSLCFSFTSTIQFVLYILQSLASTPGAMANSCYSHHAEDVTHIYLAYTWPLLRWKTDDRAGYSITNIDLFTGIKQQY